MSRGAQTFKQVDVTKALKGAMNAGIEVDRVEITDGKIVIFADRGQAARLGEPILNEWDAVK
jgi:hypothetical protein